MPIPQKYYTELIINGEVAETAMTTGLENDGYVKAMILRGNKSGYPWAIFMRIRSKMYKDGTMTMDENLSMNKKIAAKVIKIKAGL